MSRPAGSNGSIPSTWDEGNTTEGQQSVNLEQQSTGSGRTISRLGRVPCLAVLPFERNLSTHFGGSTFQQMGQRAEPTALCDAAHFLDLGQQVAWITYAFPMRKLRCCLEPISSVRGLTDDG